MLCVMDDTPPQQRTEKDADDDVTAIIHQHAHNNSTNNTPLTLQHPFLFNPHTTSGTAATQPRLLPRTLRPPPPHDFASASSRGCCGATPTSFPSTTRPSRSTAPRNRPRAWSSGANSASQTATLSKPPLLAQVCFPPFLHTVMFPPFVGRVVTAPGADFGAKAGVHMTVADFLNMGKVLCDSILDYFDPDQVRRP